MQDNLDAALAEEDTTDISDRSMVSATFAYREKLGALLYCMIIMRPDLMYVVHMLARFNNRQCTGVHTLGLGVILNCEPCSSKTYKR